MELRASGEVAQRRDAGARRGRPRPAGGVECHLGLTTSPTDEALARIVSLLRRHLWTVLELHHRCGPDRNELEVTAAKADGDPARLVAALEREVVVIDVVAAPC